MCCNYRIIWVTAVYYCIPALGISTQTCVSKPMLVYKPISSSTLCEVHSSCQFKSVVHSSGTSLVEGWYLRLTSNTSVAFLIEKRGRNIKLLWIPHIEFRVRRAYMAFGQYWWTFSNWTSNKEILDFECSNSRPWAWFCLITAWFIPLQV